MTVLLTELLIELSSGRFDELDEPLDSMTPVAGGWLVLLGDALLGLGEVEVG